MDVESCVKTQGWNLYADIHLRRAAVIRHDEAEGGRTTLKEERLCVSSWTLGLQIF